MSVYEAVNEGALAARNIINKTYVSPPPRCRTTTLPVPCLKPCRGRDTIPFFVHYQTITPEFSAPVALVPDLLFRITGIIGIEVVGSFPDTFWVDNSTHASPSSDLFFFGNCAEPFLDNIVQNPNTMIVVGIENAQ
jgi:hypothetical protein